MERVGRSLLAAGALALVVATSGGTGAEPRASSKRFEVLREQFRLLDGRLARQYSHSSRLVPKGGEILPRWEGSYRGRWLAPARAAARRHGVPEDLFLRLVERESGWNPAARSPKGAVGLAQLMPETAARLGVDPRDPVQNLEGGARYLRRLFERFGSWKLALAAYNAGPEAVTRHRGVPPYAETQAYVKAILPDF